MASTAGPRANPRSKTRPVTDDAAPPSQLSVQHETAETRPLNIASCLENVEARLTGIIDNLKNNLRTLHKLVAGSQNRCHQEVPLLQAPSPVRALPPPVTDVPPLSVPQTMSSSLPATAAIGTSTPPALSRPIPQLGPHHPAPSVVTFTTRSRNVTWDAFCLLAVCLLLATAVSASTPEHAENTLNAAIPASASVTEVVFPSPTSTQDQEAAQAHSEAPQTHSALSSSSQTHASDAYPCSSPPPSILSAFFGSSLPTPDQRGLDATAQRCRRQSWIPEPVKALLRARRGGGGRGGGGGSSGGGKGGGGISGGGKSGGSKSGGGKSGGSKSGGSKSGGSKSGGKSGSGKSGGGSGGVRDGSSSEGDGNDTAPGTIPSRSAAVALKPFFAFGTTRTIGAAASVALSMVATMLL